MVHLYNEILFGNKKNEILTHATTWINLKNIMLSEKRNQSQKTIYYDSIHIKSRMEKSMETENRLVVT